MKAMKVLIIEDDRQIVESSVAILSELRSTGAIITSAAEGKKGVELARENLPDIIILDSGLPDIDGFEALRQIRNFSDVPIIILTTLHEEVYKVKGLELGADDYVTKPFYPYDYDFLSRLKAVLSCSLMHKEQQASDDLPLTELLLVKS